jgi:hypothetical protein
VDSGNLQTVVQQCVVKGKASDTFGVFASNNLKVVGIYMRLNANLERLNNAINGLMLKTRIPEQMISVVVKTSKSLLSLGVLTDQNNVKIIATSRNSRNAYAVQNVDVQIKDAAQLHISAQEIGIVELSFNVALN